MAVTAAAERDWRHMLPAGIRPYTEAAPISALFLGISSGFPYAMIGATLTTRLKQDGIDKATIKGSTERLTQPGMMAIVYSQAREAEEYREYLDFLRAEGHLTGAMEELELEDLQGVQGLRALRVQVALDRICALSGWAIGHLYLKTVHDGPMLDPTAVWHFDDPTRFEAFRAATEDTRVEPGIGLPGQVLVSGEPAWYEDLYEVAHFKRVPAAKQVGLRSGFAFPVLVGPEVVGVLDPLRVGAAFDRSLA